MSVRYRFVIETPWASMTHEEDVEFDYEPSESDLVAVLDDIYANNFPSSWERLDD